MNSNAVIHYEVMTAETHRINTRFRTVVFGFVAVLAFTLGLMICPFRQAGDPDSFRGVSGYESTERSDSEIADTVAKALLWDPELRREDFDLPEDWAVPHNWDGPEGFKAPDWFK